MKKTARKYRKRSNTLLSFWFQVGRDYHIDNKSVSEIAGRYINPFSRKPYSRGNIYHILSQLEEMFGEDLINELKK